MPDQMTIEVDDRTESKTTPFTSSRRLAIADQFRIPYAIEPPQAGTGVGRLRTAGGGDLLWAEAAACARRSQLISTSRPGRASRCSPG